ncbi:Scr1 family TA system antitoxin-like transcriptional regulator [Nocardiopsis aegyptia]|uniref:Transcriptional regulator with XRE-family HTH domain n=1 Tax=Nocardiopsis aegyptia TaxID=220378 RepID=A0A7Z0J8I7_9ACTN|nr:Scr1 family TA system antitoxin-like transcriptional regulator [Nocardiopsis aegyptia]NYJ33031.1 transcriptional regulator with XRE-family HTH domain [Nocardiopsis aegyptia]
MKHSFSPTIRRRRLARILRDLREESGDTLDAAAKKSGVPRATLGKLETAAIKQIRPAHLDALAKLYGVGKEAWESMHQLAKDASEQGWWSKYKDVFSPTGLASFEVEASFVRVFEAQVIPGLLQTPDYTRAVFMGANSYSEDRIRRHVAARMERQDILERLYPPEYAAVIDEGVLRRQAGGPKTMREQLHHLVQMAERPNIAIQVVPFSAGTYAANLGSFQIMEFSEPNDPTIGYAETPTSTLYVESPEEIRRYDAMWREASAAALSVAQTVDFVRNVVESLEDGS